MDDTINRQAAIDALDVLCQEHRYKIPGKRETYSQYNEAWQDALGRAECAIGDLPPAQPTVDAVPVAHGRWKAVTEDMVTYKRICSCCGEEAPFDESEDVYLLYPHCPWCGASLDIKGGNGNG